MHVVYNVGTNRQTGDAADFNGNLGVNYVMTLKTDCCDQGRPVPRLLNTPLTQMGSGSGGEAPLLRWTMSLTGQAVRSWQQYQLA